MPSTPPPAATYDEVMEVARRVRNWGRWGPADQLGTINLLTPAGLRAAAALVRGGKVISCGLPYDQAGPQTGTFGRHNPVLLMMQDGGDAASGAQDHLPALRYADDAIFMPLQCGTQWDALSHVFHDGVMYNGYDQTLVNSNGAQVNGIEQMAAKVARRGILFDIPRHRGVPWLEAGDGISGAELQEYVASKGIELRAGDIALVRTGMMAMCRERGSWGDYAGGDAPGLDLSAAEWLCQNDFAAVATDTWGMEVRPNQTADIFQPLHVVLIVNAGMLVGEIFDLDPLARDCAADGQYVFLFVAAPLPFTGAVGSPLNPIALK